MALKRQINRRGYGKLDLVAIGSRIRKRRLALKLSQAELGRLAGGIHVQSISKYERGVRAPLANVGDLSRALGMTNFELLTGQAVSRKFQRGLADAARDLRPQMPGQGKAADERVPGDDPPGLVLVAQNLRVSPEFLPWVLGLLRIFRSGKAEAIGGIRASINAFLGDLDYQKVEPVNPTGRGSVPKKGRRVAHGSR